MRSHPGTFIGEISMQSLSQHRSRRGETRGMTRTVLLGEFAASTSASQRLTRSSRAGRSLITIPVRPASLLATFARAKRTQLEALEAAGVTASLRQEVEGRTWLASLLPAREKLPEAVARRAIRRVFTLHQPRAVATLEKRD
jgi:hypothetical protein